MNAPTQALTPEAEASLLAAIFNTPADHPDKEKLDGFLLDKTPDADFLRRFQPRDLRACTDTER